MGRIRLFALCILLALAALTAGTGKAQGVSLPPERHEDNLIVAFYNIKWLGNTPHDLSKLADVIQHFDICAVLEIKQESELKELWETLVNQTGEDWGYVMGPRTNRPRGSYHESYAYLYRRDRVEVGNGLTSNIFDQGEVYRNDPMLATFVSDIGEFTLLAIHTRWSNDEDGTRAGEVKAIPGQLQMLRDRLEVENIIVGGDFNYKSSSRVLQNAMRQADLIQVDNSDKTTFKRAATGYANDYDHIFVSREVEDMVVNKARALDVTTLIYGDRSVANMKKSKSELSDHLPVFVELSDSSDDDISGDEEDE